MAENSRELTLTRVFDAPRELVFRAWTDPEMLAKWWGPKGVTNPEEDIELDAWPGGSMRVVMLAGEELGEMAGQRWPMQGTFKEVIENEKLIFANQAVDLDGNVLIDGVTTVTFEDENGKTKMTMRTVAKPVAAPAEQMLQGMNQGWSESFDKLTELVNT